MAALVRCRWCHHPLVPAGRPQPSMDRVREAHCPNPACNWCRPCYDRRCAAIKAGRGDLLGLGLDTVPDPGPPTQEIPPTYDGPGDIPPDQMT